MNRSKKTRFFLVFAELANSAIVARAHGLDPLDVACFKQKANKASPFPSRWPEVNSRKQNIQIAIKNAPLIRERLRERLRDRVSATLISPPSWCVSRVLLRVWRYFCFSGVSPVRPVFIPIPRGTFKRACMYGRLGRVFSPVA